MQKESRGGDMTRRLILRIIVGICIVTILFTVIGFHTYQKLMEDVQIIQYFDSVADNLNWQTVYVRVVVPEDQYKKGWTENAIRLYIIIRSKNIPNRIDMVLYDNMDTFRDCDEYVKASFKK